MLQVAGPHHNRCACDLGFPWGVDESSVVNDSDRRRASSNWYWSLDSVDDVLEPQGLHQDWISPAVSNHTVDGDVVVGGGQEWLVPMCNRPLEHQVVRFCQRFGVEGFCSEVTTFTSDIVGALGTSPRYWYRTLSCQHVGWNLSRVDSPENLLSSTDPVWEVVVLAHRVGVQHLAQPVQSRAELDVWDEELVVVSFADVGVEPCGLHDGRFILGEITCLDGTPKFFAVPPGSKIADGRTALIELASKFLDGVVGGHSLTQTNRPGCFVLEGVFQMSHHDADGSRPSEEERMDVGSEV